jgi:hypothetical protein
MVTDEQVRRLMELIQIEDTLAMAAAKAGMDEKTARKYRRSGRLPSQTRAAHTWRTRLDAFEAAWPALKQMLKLNPGLEAKTLFQYLQRTEPGRYADGQLRTLQRRVKIWKALEGPAKEVFFPQQHHPGQRSQSDFTDMSGLGVTIQGQPFDHLVHHFVLTYSNWETGTICFSESFEALSAGVQDALWELGGVPETHQTDCLSAAVHKLDHPEQFTERYRALMAHYGLEPRRTNPHSPNENGDVEQSHHRLYRAMDQSLMLRGRRDFDARPEYEAFMRQVFAQLNAGRQERFAEEVAILRRLPPQRTEDYTRKPVRVSRFSTISVGHNTYSVHSRLIHERVDVRLYADHLEVYYAQTQVECMPRLRGKGGHRIEYRHIIDWLVRKPGAFPNYRYRDDLFPTTRFRMAYDELCGHHSESEAVREYLQLLDLAAHTSEDRVEAALTHLLDTQEPLSAARVEALVEAAQEPPGRGAALSVTVAPVDLRIYDSLLSTPSEAEAA